MILALAFSPPNDVVDAFKRLTDLIRNQYADATDGVPDYFEDTYIGRFRRNAARAIPKFPNSDVEYVSLNSGGPTPHK